MVLSYHLLLLFFKISFYLKSRFTEGGGETKKERERKRPSAGALHKLTQKHRDGLVISQEVCSYFWVSQIGAPSWDILCCFSRPLASRWIRSGVARTWTSTHLGYQYHKQRLNRLCHGVGHSYNLFHISWCVLTFLKAIYFYQQKNELLLFLYNLTVSTFYPQSRWG